jgi:luciferase family oxidoreductase group 1
MGDDVGGRLRLSILDHTPVSSGSTLGDAFWHSTRLAELAEQIGYERYWVAEHHNMPWLASSSPAVLIAHVAARTTRLRVGSGGVMLPNYAPLAVVEQFGMLEELHPGRIDLRWGRSSGGDQIASHARRRTDQDFAPLLAELLAFFRGEFPEGHPYGSVTAVPGQGTMPNIWLLGSGTYSAQLAGAIGLPFGHSGHFAAANNVTARSRRIVSPSVGHPHCRSHTQSSQWELSVPKPTKLPSATTTRRTSALYASCLVLQVRFSRPTRSKTGRQENGRPPRSSTSRRSSRRISWAHRPL